MLRTTTSLLVIVVAGCATTPVVDESRLAEAAASGICPVHGVSMSKETARIQYGFHASPFGEALEAQRSRFPFAYRPLFGSGSLPLPGDPLFAEIFVCAKCEKAKARWIRGNASHPWAKAWQEEDRPNKAPEPTPTSVMPRANEGRIE